MRGFSLLLIAGLLLSALSLPSLAASPPQVSFLPSVSFTYPSPDGVLVAGDNSVVYYISIPSSSVWANAEMHRPTALLTLTQDITSQARAESITLPGLLTSDVTIIPGGAVRAGGFGVLGPRLDSVTPCITIAGGSANQMSIGNVTSATTISWSSWTTGIGLASRLYPGAAYLPVKKAVVMIGGEDATGAGDPSIYVWDGANAPALSPTSIANGKRAAVASTYPVGPDTTKEGVLVVGGVLNLGPVNTVEFMMLTNASGFNVLTAGLRVPRESACVAYSPKANIFYIACGNVLADGGDLIEVYNPANNTVMTSLEFHIPDGPREYCQCVCVGNYFFLAGGRDRSGTAVSTVLLYDVLAREWLWQNGFSDNNVPLPNRKGTGVYPPSSTEGWAVFTDSQGFYVYDQNGNFLTPSTAILASAFTPSPASSSQPTTSPSPFSPSPSSPPATSASGCIAAAPFVGAVCVNGVWSVSGSTNHGGSTSVQSPVVIAGDLVLDPTSTIEIAQGNAPLVNVQGTATLGGTLVIDIGSVIDDGTVLPILIASGGINGSFTDIDVVQPSGDCRRYSGSPSQQGNTFGVLINTDSSGCSSKKGLSTGAIIGISVGGGVFVLAAAAILVLMLAKKFDWSFTRTLFKRGVRTRADQPSLYT